MTLQKWVLTFWTPCTSGLSNLNKPRAANCQLSLLTGQKSVANVNYTSLPLLQWWEEKEKITNCRKLNQNVTI